MNVRSPLVKEKETTKKDSYPIFFNNTQSHFIVTTHNSISIFSTSPLRRLLTRNFNFEDEVLVMSKLLNGSNFIGIITHGTDYQNTYFILYDDSTQNEVFRIQRNDIRDFYLDSEFIILVFDSNVEIYKLDNDFKMIKKLDIRDSSKIYYNSGKLLFASPWKSGQAHLLDIKTEKSMIIKACKSSIRNLRLSQDNSKIAICSQKGTIIRMFDSNTGALLRSYRRGSDEADIYEMQFNRNGTKLAVVSDKQTLHIFDININEQSVRRHVEPIRAIYKAKLHSGNSKKKENCKIAWGVGEEDGVVLVWNNSKIWEKYVMLENHNLVRESWREF